ncbi:hypothetical protein NLI96_g11007 [Meripilus lineatus]|uniref:Uncharacterized protein n=1 Tax=Meripilus lineatus TaxID=2056292 RepID=A0AAD5USI9_9APHY|nr:hypothetical protein NLI96_g11007 [Physisporinus lineatus]
MSRARLSSTKIGYAKSVVHDLRLFNMDWTNPQFKDKHFGSQPEHTEADVLLTAHASEGDTAQPTLCTRNRNPSRSCPRIVSLHVDGTSQGQKGEPVVQKASEAIESELPNVALNNSSGWAYPSPSATNEAIARASLLSRLSSPRSASMRTDYLSDIPGMPRLEFPFKYPNSLTV